MEREETWILPATLLAVASVIWATAFALLTGFSDPPSGMATLTIAIAVVTLAACGRFVAYIYKMWVTGAPNPLSRIQSDFGAAARDFVPILVGVAILGIFLSSMNFLKSMIVVVVPFWADAPLAALDRILNVDGQSLASKFQPAVGELGVFYGFWHAIQLGGILWVLHWRQGDKDRLIIGFMLTWAIGMATAYAFSSAGPIFTGRFDPGLAPESMRHVVHFLWANYIAGTATLGAGISAFPSMHVAIATWFALVLRERGLLWLGIAYALAIFACSIILGWHYSADGVGGAAVALLADRLSNSWVRHRRLGRPMMPEAAAISS